MAEELLDVDAACQFIGGTRPIHRATLWRGVKAGRFSKPIKIGLHAIRWRRGDLLADIERMNADRESDAA